MTTISNNNNNNNTSHFPSSPAFKAEQPDEENDYCLEFDGTNITNDFSCRGCGNRVFTIHRENAYNPRTNTTEHYTPVAVCVSCFGSTLVSQLSESYDNSNLVRLSNLQIRELDNILNSQKENMLKIVNNTDKIETENHRLNIAKSMIVLQKIIDLVKNNKEVNKEN